MKIAKAVFMPNCVLGEGCVWNRNERALYFTDIESCLIYRFDPSAGSVKICPAGARTGCLVFGRSGGLLTAETNRLVYRKDLDAEADVLLEQTFPDYLRYNDGKCDRYGNLWVGTMAISQSHPGAVGGGSLYCIKENRVAAEYGGYTIPNGMVWNEDGSVFYHIDTKLQEIYACDVKEEIRLTGRRTVLRIPESEGSPDGMCMDAEGNLWVAMWGGGKVNGYRISTGEKLEEIRVPETYVSCCCFGGEDQRTLFITTARGDDGSGGQIYRADLPVGGGRVFEYGGC